MRTATRSGLRSVAVAALLATSAALVTAGGAWSYMRSSGGGTGTGTTSTLSAPSSVSASAANGGPDVAVTWTAPNAGAAPYGYRVQRTNASTGTTVDACGTSASTRVTASSCTDTGVSDGSYRYVVVAVRAGWTATSAPSATMTVQSPVATATTLTSTPNPSTVAQSVTYTATVNATSGTPSGSVTFRDAGQPISCSGGTQTLNGSGVATCQTTYASAGSHQITAAYAGSAPYTASTSAALTQQVVQRSQAVTFTSTAPGSAAVGGASYAITATATSGLAVTFASATPSVCTVSGASVSYVAAGTCTVRADQAGNATYAAAPQVTQTFAVVKGSQTITFTSTAPGSATVGGAGYAVTATATSGLTVTFASATPSVCTVSGASVTYVAAGTCTVTADQPGNAGYAAATQVAQTFTVAKGSQTITFTSAAPAAAMLGDAAYAVAATATSGLAVAFTSATPSVCTVSGAGVSYLAAGTCTITADQPGNAGFTAAPQVSQSFLVTAPAPAAPTGLTVNTTAGTATATWTTVSGYTYECQIVTGNSTPGASSWVSCTTPYAFTPKSGTQTFYVRAVRGGVASTPASLSFKP
jgi:hypothetical protein